MIQTRIWGGLGNQMFQFIVGYSLAKKKRTELGLDISFFSKSHQSRRITKREIGLFQFPGIKKLDLITINNKRTFVSIMQIPVINYFARKIPKEYVKIFGYVLETKYKYHEQLFNEGDSDIYLDGYWHCEKYFSDIRNDVVSMFTFVDEQVMDEYRNLVRFGENTVAVHVRRGDYISQNNPNVMSENYYRKAIAYVSKQIDKPVFCFFSDDVSWTKNTFSDIPNALIANERRVLSDVQELQLMRMCSNQIISNSSYSWWGAWLNEKKDKIIIAPKIWLNKSDMMPDDWIRI